MDGRRRHEILPFPDDDSSSSNKCCTFDECCTWVKVGIFTGLAGIVGFWFKQARIASGVIGCENTWNFDLSRLRPSRLHNTLFNYSPFFTHGNCSQVPSSLPYEDSWSSPQNVPDIVSLLPVAVVVLVLLYYLLEAICCRSSCSTRRTSDNPYMQEADSSDDGLPPLTTFSKN